MEYKGRQIILIKSRPNDELSDCTRCCLSYGEIVCVNAECAGGYFGFADQKEPTFTTTQIKDAYAEWLDDSGEADSFITFLKNHSDPEFAEYQRLKAKFGGR